MTRPGLRSGRLRTTIDQQTAQGANTTEAERKYAEADRLLKSAESGNISVRSSTVQKASTLIDESTKSLDQASAQAVIDRAAAQIKNVDEMLTFFKANKGALERSARRRDHGQARERAAVADERTRQRGSG